MISITAPTSASTGDRECLLPPDPWGRHHARNSAQPIQRVELRCRFEMMAADAPSGHELWVFDLPGCKECPKTQLAVRDAGKFGRPCEVGGVTRMGCTRPPPKALRPNRRGQPWIGAVHSRGEPDPVQETSRGSARRRGAGSAFEVAGG